MLSDEGSSHDDRDPLAKSCVWSDDAEGHK